MAAAASISIERPDCLASAATRALIASDPAEKTALTNDMARLWEARRLSLVSPAARRLSLPARPGRPDRPQLLPPAKVPRRSINSRRGRIALLHAIAHIELNAIDLALDIIARFAPIAMPRSFFDGWVMVAKEEAKHFGLLQARLADFDTAYGNLPAHDGLWEAAQRTGHDLAARLAVVPLVLEARGLDVTPGLIGQIEAIGDHRTAAIFRIIYEDEKGHVAVGAKWFRYLCHKQGREPAAAFQQLVRSYFRGPLKPPFNDLARARSGITPGFYRALSPAGN
ncbi:MAG: ferritin-like domain-containing protein [Nitratireductor sp.]|nr:ferritin-like domain-containing protein [Nitratireductor sp.]